MGVAMAARAGMLSFVRVDTASQRRGLIGVTRFALNLRRLRGVRIIVNVLVAVAALEHTMNTGVELVGIDADVFAVGVLHGGVAVAGKTIDVRVQRPRGHDQKKR
jgi:hypothetical protein